MLRTINRNNKSVNFSLPAPCGGLNMRDSLDKMDKSDAIKMDNYIPNDTKITLRKGYTQYTKSKKAFLTLASYEKYEKSFLRPALLNHHSYKKLNLSLDKLK